MGGFSRLVVVGPVSDPQIAPHAWRLASVRVSMDVLARFDLWGAGGR